MWYWAYTAPLNPLKYFDLNGYSYFIKFFFNFQFFLCESNLRWKTTFTSVEPLQSLKLLLLNCDLEEVLK